VLGISEKAVNKNGEMVIPMQKDEWLLTQYYEDCVTKFDYFGKDKG